MPLKSCLFSEPCILPVPSFLCHSDSQNPLCTLRSPPNATTYVKFVLVIITKGIFSFSKYHIVVTEIPPLTTKLGSQSLFVS